MRVRATLLLTLVLPLTASLPASAEDQWAWLSGSQYSDAYGNYGTKGVPAGTNVPGSRYRAAGCGGADGNLWLFGGAGYNATANGNLADLWRYDGTCWTWVSGSAALDTVGVYGTKGTPAAGNRPGSRSFAASWVGADGALWFFGGSGYGTSASFGNLNDLWKYDGTNWTWVSGSDATEQYGIYGTKGVAAATNVPGARFGALAWAGADGNLWLFGGYGLAAGSPGYLNDLWRFDGTYWTWITGSDAPDQRATFGTRGVAAAGNVPGARGASVGWRDAAGNLWLFGGYGFDGIGQGTLNDLWKFDGTYWT